MPNEMKSSATSLDASTASSLDPDVARLFAAASDRVAEQLKAVAGWSPPQSGGRLDAWERGLHFLKEAGLLTVSVAALIVLAPVVPKLVANLTRVLSTGDIQTVTILGVQVEVKTSDAPALETNLRSAAVTGAPTAGKEDLPLTASSKAVFDAARSLAPNAPPTPVSGESYWVYLGAQKDGTWARRLFTGPTTLPKVGDPITASRSVFFRRALPMDVGGDNWKLGDTAGVWREGETLIVKNVQSLPGTDGHTLWWAQVRAGPGMPPQPQ